MTTKFFPLLFSLLVILAGRTIGEEEKQDSVTSQLSPALAVDIVDNAAAEDEQTRLLETDQRVYGDDHTDHLSQAEQALEDFDQTIQETQANSSGPSELSVTSSAVKSKLSRPRINCIQAAHSPSNLVGEDLERAETEEEPRLLLINGTELQTRMAEETSTNVTNRTAPGVCSIILFYGNWCQFSARAAPSFNALPRFFPRLNFYAIEVANNLNVFSQFAVVALPSVLVFHNGKPVSGFNNSVHSLETYIHFIGNYTGIKPSPTLEPVLVEEDYKGPVPNTVIERFNYNLLVAYLFILLCLLVKLTKSSYARSLIDTMRNLWREVEIQHEHVD